MQQEQEQFFFLAYCRGEYSVSFGWDTGLSGEIHSEVSLQEAERFAEGFTTPFNTDKTVNEMCNEEYGGTRGSIIVIKGSSLDDAKQTLENYCSLWAVAEYKD